MYLPKDLISHLYTQLRQNWHATSPPVLILVALEPDALCACRILTALLKRDYISHNIVPVSGYGELSRIGQGQIQPMRLQNGGAGGTVICLGVGGLVDLGAVLGLETEDEDEDEDATGGVELWVIDARRPWNLGNVFGGKPPEQALGEVNGNARARLQDVSFGQIQRNYRSGKGGIIVFDDGDIDEHLEKEREAYFKLEQMPLIEDDGEESDHSDTESEGGDPSDGARAGSKRKSSSDADADDSDEENDRPRQRRRSNSQESIPITPERPARHGLLSTQIPNSFPSSSESPSSPSKPPPSHQEKQVSLRTKRRRLLRLKRQHEATLHSYYSTGTSYSEPIAALLYSLISDLGREDNNALWHAIVGVTSLELYGRSSSGVGISRPSESGGSAGWGGPRGEGIRQCLRDEVRRLNPPDAADSRLEATRGEQSGVIPTTARSPTDTSIRLSPEPRFLLIRHWSLYDSMIHSPYLAARLHLWNSNGTKRLHKFLAKMGISLAQCKQSYTHMDMDLKRKLRPSLLRYAPMYGLDGLVPPASDNPAAREGWGFVRSWGWKACLSAADVGVIVGAILEVGKGTLHTNSRASSGESSQRSTDPIELLDQDGRKEGESYVARFWDAYDALDNVAALLASLPATQHLHRAILRTGTALMTKQAMKHVRAFRIGVVKEGPDVQLFTHPGALTKLALWVAEAVAEREHDDKGGKKGATPLVLASLNEERGVYVVVGTGGGGGVIDFTAKRRREEKKREKEKKKAEKKIERGRRREEKRAKAAEDGEEYDEDEDDETEDEDSEEDEDEDEDDQMSGKSKAKNRFGNAFQEVVEETGSRVRIDSFEHCVVEVKKDDLGGFLEALSMKAVIG